LTNLLLAVGVCKWSISIINISCSLSIIMLTIFFCSICRIQILNQRRNMIFDVGFIDPYIIQEEIVYGFNKKQRLNKQHDRIIILFSLTTLGFVTILYTFYFAYSILSVINKLFMSSMYKQLDILLVIHPYSVFDSWRKEKEEYQDMIDILQK
jgi:hypothetical protein